MFGEADVSRHEVGLELLWLELNGVVVLVDGRLDRGGEGREREEKFDASFVV